MKAVVLGGTSGMGRALGQRLSELGNEVFLMGIDADQLARSAADLKARDPEQRDVGHAVCDLERPADFAGALDQADAALGGFDTVIVTAGMFATQEKLESDVELARRLVTVNYANTVAFCEHARKRLLARGGGKLVVFSSVAGDRGRKPVAIYGSSKAGLSAYLEALDHKFHDQGLTVVCVKPGFVKTAMTTGLKPPPFAGEPEGVAESVLKAMQSGRAVVYTPAMWGVVMAVIRKLPRFVMRRIGF
ncbi:MAG TPA: SDR family NAD(P)-dependent oxidoreductase [Polyangiaceae bacterium]|nr:SDR family NAD(P)-dependent oxidoreductase [Polyangiaceae bacterium]